MLCRDVCPRGLECRPLSNVVSDCDTSVVCVGLHGEQKPEEYADDIYRHCFITAQTDTMHDYDRYDLTSVLSVFSEVLLLEELR